MIIVSVLESSVLLELELAFVTVSLALSAVELFCWATVYVLGECWDTQIFGFVDR